MRMLHHCFMILFICSLAIAVHSESAFAQEDQTYRVETVDGNTFTGMLISEDEEKIVLNTESLGEITIKKSTIRSMQKLDPRRMQDDSYWFESPQSTRYFFAPNAIGLKKGAGYYQNTWIFFNNANYGLTDNISIGGGIVPLFLLGSPYTPVWLLPKVSFPVSDEQIYISAGAMIGGVVGESSGSAGLLYGASTVGNTDHNLTLGLGYGYGNGEISSTPVVNLSGAVRVSSSIFLISENYIFTGSDITGIGSLGGRWATQNFALDFALFRPFEGTGSFIGIPWLGFSIPFGN